MWLTRPPRGTGLGMFMFYHAQVLKPGAHGRFTNVGRNGRSHQDPHAACVRVAEGQQDGGGKREGGKEPQNRDPEGQRQLQSNRRWIPKEGAHKAYTRAQRVEKRPGSPTKPKAPGAVPPGKHPRGSQWRPTPVDKTYELSRRRSGH